MLHFRTRQSDKVKKTAPLACRLRVLPPCGSGRLQGIAGSVATAVPKKMQQLIISYDILVTKEHLVSKNNTVNNTPPQEFGLGTPKI